jgi:hypothetical protein
MIVLINKKLFQIFLGLCTKRVEIKKSKKVKMREHLTAAGHTGGLKNLPNWISSANQVVRM